MLKQTTYSKKEKKPLTKSNQLRRKSVLTANNLHISCISNACLYWCSQRIDDPAMALWPHVVTRWKHCKDTQTRSLREGQLLWRLIRKRWSTSHAQTDGVQQKKKSKKCLFFSLSLYLVVQLCFPHPNVSFIRRPSNWFLVSFCVFVILSGQCY